MRDKVMFQLHFGAAYNQNGGYGWSRNLDAIKKTFAWELEWAYAMADTCGLTAGCR